MTDWAGFAVPLAEKLDYTNTFYHKEPKLDILNIDPRMEGTLDFLLSSEIFEHIPPPVSRAFVNARRLLKPGGVMIFTVPYTLKPQTVEHFPELHDFTIVRDGGEYLLKNITPDGREQEYRNLKFHGGPGSTLEMRVFSENGLREEFAKAGFGSVTIYGTPNFDYGIYYKESWSLPMSARIPELTADKQTRPG